MNKMIAYCGIVCTECPAFLATQKEDDAKRKEIAEAWSKQYKMAIKPEDINCDGCKSQGKRIIGYSNICEIRKCGKEKQVENCAYCDEYGCEKLTKFLAMAPQAKTTLEAIRKSPKSK
jgi:RecJ-like exonuclease